MSVEITGVENIVQITIENVGGMNAENTVWNFNIVETLERDIATSS